MLQPTLFLDRDGVINRRTVGDYIRRPADFMFETVIMRCWSQARWQSRQITAIRTQIYASMWRLWIPAAEICP